MAELALNNRISTVIRESAFFTNYNKYLNLFNTPRKSPQADIALKRLVI